MPCVPRHPRPRALVAGRVRPARARHRRAADGCRAGARRRGLRVRPVGAGRRGVPERGGLQPVPRSRRPPPPAARGRRRRGAPQRRRGTDLDAGGSGLDRSPGRLAAVLGDRSRQGLGGDRFPAARLHRLRADLDLAAGGGGLRRQRRLPARRSGAPTRHRHPARGGPVGRHPLPLRRHRHAGRQTVHRRRRHVGTGRAGRPPPALDRPGPRRPRRAVRGGLRRRSLREPGRAHRPDVHRGAGHPRRRRGARVRGRDAVRGGRGGRRLLLRRCVARPRTPERPSVAVADRPRRRRERRAGAPRRLRHAVGWQPHHAVDRRRCRMAVGLGRRRGHDARRGVRHEHPVVGVGQGVPRPGRSRLRHLGHRRRPRRPREGRDRRSRGCLTSASCSPRGSTGGPRCAV